jgi:7-carboxy-7-deazaguanine synthase
MKVIEIYETIVGEGGKMGYPCTILRLGGCNLRCKWCDTEYAFDVSDCLEITVDEVARKLQELGHTKVMITGGEPLMQGKEVELLMSKYPDYYYMVQTNGSMSIKPVMDDADLICMDIKTPSSGMAGKFYEENLDMLCPYDEIKFVVADNIDYKFAVDTIKKYELDKIFNVFLSPVDADSKTAKKVTEWLVKDKLENVRISVQQHKIVGVR